MRTKTLRCNLSTKNVHAAEIFKNIYPLHSINYNITQDRTGSTHILIIRIYSNYIREPLQHDATKLHVHGVRIKRILIKIYSSRSYYIDTRA